MNLRVDLILETEQRSASVINAKSLVRIGVITVPLIILIVIGLIVVNLMKLKGDLRTCEGQWEDAKPKKEEAAALKAALNATQVTDRELKGWQVSHLDLNNQLATLQKRIPGTIQLQDLRITHSIQVTNAIPVRAFSMVLQGTAMGESAEANEASVQALKTSIEKDPLFAELVAEAKITKVRASTDRDAPKSHRSFEISCTYKPRKFQ